MKLAPIASCLACPFNFHHQFEGPLCMHDAENPIKLADDPECICEDVSSQCPLDDWKPRAKLKVLEHPGAKE